MSGILCALVGRNGGRQLTVGNSGVTSYGFSNGSYGSLTPGEFLDANITRLDWTTSNTLQLGIDAVVANSGWTSISINGNVYQRSSATFTNPTGSSAWSWSGVTTNPFGTTAGVIIPVNIA
jgi:hypothetical protein